MRCAPILVLAFVLFLPLLAAPSPAHAANCSFVLGFKSLDDALGGVVGQCVVDEHHNPANGDGLQETTNGLLVWRKADNWTAFTDGYHTWINGPFGIVKRLNTACFAWEKACVTGTGGSTAPGTTVSFTSVVGAPPGGTASVTVQTSPNIPCTIDYWGPRGVDRYEFGDLHRKTSDANGSVSWSWPISPFTPIGNGTVAVNCNGTAATTPIPIGSGPIAVSFTSVTGAAPGGTASATIQTSPGAFCKVDYFGPRGVDRFEGGALHAQQADANGNITWGWPIAANTPSGNGTVTVNCEGATASAAVPIS
jgi:hypothetical protein